MSRATLAALRKPLAALRRTGQSGRTSPGLPGGRERMLADGGPDDRDDDHLRDVPDGAGCTEIWEHLSEHTGGEHDD